MARNVVLIDGERFKKEIYKKNRNLQMMSKELGYSRSYLAIAVHSGRLTESVVRMLDQIYGIPRERYEVKESVETDDEVAEIKESLDKDALYELIKRAVYEGVKKAWAEL